jgi:hypothetical protein
MVGDLQGIAGKAMPEIPNLDIPLLEASTDSEAKAGREAAPSVRTLEKRDGGRVCLMGAV